MSEVIHLCEEGWNDLAHAVVVQAVKDFKTAYKALRKHPDRKEPMKEVREITKFFASEYFESLFDLDGPALLRKVKEELDDKSA